MRYYLVVVEGDIFPVLKGPFRTKEERGCAARNYKRKHGDEDGLYMLDVTPMGRAGVDTYSPYSAPCPKKAVRKP